MSSVRAPLGISERSGATGRSPLRGGLGAAVTRRTTWGDVEGEGAGASKATLGPKPALEFDRLPPGRVESSRAGRAALDSKRVRRGCAPAALAGVSGDPSAEEGAARGTELYGFKQLGQMILDEDSRWPPQYPQKGGQSSKSVKISGAMDR